MIPEEIATELGRAVRRWHQLPLDRAADALPGVLAFLADLEGEDLPDLGPRVAMDQLMVVVHDACADGRVDGVGERLATLRLSWSPSPTR